MKFENVSCLYLVFTYQNINEGPVHKCSVQCTVSFFFQLESFHQGGQRRMSMTNFYSIILSIVLIIIVQKLNYSEAQNARRRECATFDGGINMCSYESHNDMIRKLQNIGKFLFNSEIRGLCSKKPLNYLSTI